MRSRPAHHWASTPPGRPSRAIQAGSSYRRYPLRESLRRSALARAGAPMSVRTKAGTAVTKRAESIMRLRPAELRSHPLSSGMRIGSTGKSRAHGRVISRVCLRPAEMLMSPPPPINCLQWASGRDSGPVGSGRDSGPVGQWAVAEAEAVSSELRSDKARWRRE